MQQLKTKFFMIFYYIVLKDKVTNICLTFWFNLSLLDEKENTQTKMNLNWNPGVYWEVCKIISQQQSWVDNILW